MAHHEFSLETIDHLRLYGQEWMPEAGTRAVIALVHGLGEHSSRYQHVAEFFNQAGIALSTYDLRGHGRSEGQRGHAPSFDALSEDIDCLLHRVTQIYKDLPCFLYGHSLGGVQVLNYALKRQPHLAGFIVTSPGLRTGTPPAAWKVALGKALYAIAPTFTMDNGLDSNDMSHKSEVNQAYQKDPLVHGKITARLGIDLLNTGQWLLAQKGPFPAPLLLMQGSADRVVDPQATRQLAENLSSDITLKLWEGGYHELHNDNQQQEVLAYLLAWVNARLEKIASPR